MLAFVLAHLVDRNNAWMLKPGGRFYLFDVVFPAEIEGYEARLDEWVRSTAERIGPGCAAEAETHIRDEYSTYDWIMEGLLERAGFRIDRVQYNDSFGAIYVCTKQQG